MPITTLSETTAEPQPSASAGRQIGVGAALSIVTCLLLSVGLMSARWLVGDSRPPVLELPVSHASETNDGVDDDSKVEGAPQVLLPQQDTTAQALQLPRDNSRASDPREPQPLSQRPLDSGGELTGWNEPLPIPTGMRTAEQNSKPRYR